MNEIRLILDRGSVIRATLGSLLAAQLVFLAGAVVGFALHADLPASPAQPAEANVPAVIGSAETPPAVILPAAASTSPPDVVEPAASVVALPTLLEHSVEPPAARLAASRVAEPRGVGIADRSMDFPGFAVQFGAFRSERNARSLQADVNNRGYDAIIVRAQGESGQWLHHVQLAEQTSTEDEAKVMVARFGRVEHLLAAAVPVRESSKQ